MTTFMFALAITIVYVLLSVDSFLGNQHAQPMPDDVKLFFLFFICTSWLAFCVVVDVKR